MADQLSVGLIDEANQALTSVVRLTLPAERWTAIGAAVNCMDDAVWAGDESALRGELKNLRGAVIGTAPRARPGDDAAPTINPLSYRTTDYVTRTPIRWISAILVGGGMVLATLIVVLLVVLTVGAPDTGPRPPETTRTTTTADVPSAGASDGDGGAVYVASVGTLLVLGVVVFVFLIWRRRAGRGETSTPVAPAPRVRTAGRVPPPPDVISAVDRVVMVLAARRDDP